MWTIQFSAYCGRKIGLAKIIFGSINSFNVLMFLKNRSQEDDLTLSDKNTLTVLVPNYDLSGYF